jgi:hypothetical protein
MFKIGILPLFFSRVYVFSIIMGCFGHFIVEKTYTRGILMDSCRASLPLTGAGMTVWGIFGGFLAIFWRDPLLVPFLGVFKGKNETKSGFRQILDFFGWIIFLQVDGFEIEAV